MRHAILISLLSTFLLGCALEPDSIAWEGPVFRVTERVEDFSVCTLDGSPITLVRRNGNARLIWRSFSGCVPADTKASFLQPVLEPGLEYALAAECSPDCVWVASGFTPVVLSAHGDPDTE